MGTLFAEGIKAIIATMVACVGSMKTFFVVGLMGVLAVVLYNVAATFLEDILAWVMVQLAAVPVGDLPSGVVQLSGMGAWMAEKVNLAGMISVMVTAVSLKWMVMKIPFLKW